MKFMRHIYIHVFHINQNEISARTETKNRTKIAYKIFIFGIVNWLEISFIPSATAMMTIIMTIAYGCVLARSPTTSRWFMEHAQFFSIRIDELWWRDRDIRETDLSSGQVVVILRQAQTQSYWNIENTFTFKQNGKTTEWIKYLDGWKIELQSIFIHIDSINRIEQ